MAEREPTVIIIKGIKPGMPADYWQTSYGDILADYPVIDLDNDDQLDHLWNIRN